MLAGAGDLEPEPFLDDRGDRIYIDVTADGQAEETELRTLLPDHFVP